MLLLLILNVFLLLGLIPKQQLIVLPKNSVMHSLYPLRSIQDNFQSGSNAQKFSKIVVTVNTNCPRSRPPDQYYLDLLTTKILKLRLHKNA